MILAPVSLDKWQRSFLADMCRDYVDKKSQEIWSAETPELVHTLQKLRNSAREIITKLEEGL